MSCFTFEFGTPDSHFYTIPKGSVSHVRILSRGTTGDIYFKWPGNDLCDVPRADCEALVAWMNEQTPTSILSPTEWPPVKPRAMTKPIGWEGTFGEAVKAMKDGWKVRRPGWTSIKHLILIDNWWIRTEQGHGWASSDPDILATDWELVD